MCVCAVLQGDNRLIITLHWTLEISHRLTNFFKEEDIRNIYYINYLQLRSVVLPFVFLAVFLFFITNFSELVLTIF